MTDPRIPPSSQNSPWTTSAKTKAKFFRRAFRPPTASPWVLSHSCALLLTMLSAGAVLYHPPPPSQETSATRSLNNLAQS